MDYPAAPRVTAIGADVSGPRLSGAGRAGRTRPLTTWTNGRGRGECDFATQIASHYPLYVIHLSISAWPDPTSRASQVTQGVCRGADDDRRRGAAPGGADGGAARLLRTSYLTAARRAEPTGVLPPDRQRRVEAINLSTSTPPSTNSSLVDRRPRHTSSTIPAPARAHRAPGVASISRRPALL